MAAARMCTPAWCSTRRSFVSRAGEVLVPACTCQGLGLGLGLELGLGIGLGKGRSPTRGDRHVRVLAAPSPLTKTAIIVSRSSLGHGACGCAIKAWRTGRSLRRRNGLLK
eukprot:9473922-Pyramimonas_sp.AAC.1